LLDKNEDEDYEPNISHDDEEQEEQNHLTSPHKKPNNDDDSDSDYQLDGPSQPR